MLIFVSLIKQRRVLRQDGDAALALEVVRVHHARHDHLVVAEHAALVQHGVHQRGLAVVDVGDDGDIANLWHGILAFSFDCRFRCRVQFRRSEMPNTGAGFT